MSTKMVVTWPRPRPRRRRCQYPFGIVLLGFPCGQVATTKRPRQGAMMDLCAGHAAFLDRLPDYARRTALQEVLG